MFLIATLCFALCLVPMCMGIYLAMKIYKTPDITIDGSYTLGAVVTAILLQSSLHPLFILPLVIVIGAFAGVITGLIHTVLKIEPLLSGILVMSALYSINLILLQQSNVPLIDVKQLFNLWTESDINQATILALFSIVGLLLLVYFLNTDYGLQLRAVGENEEMSQSVGISTKAKKITGFAITNALTAVSGYLVCQYQSFTDINMGIGIVLVALGSYLLGDGLLALSPQKNIFFQVLFVVIGAIIFQCILSLALSFGVEPKYLKLITSILVLLVVALSKLKKRI